MIHEIKRTVGGTQGTDPCPRDNASRKEILSDVALNIASPFVPIFTTWATVKVSALVGTTISPGVGTIVGLIVGIIYGLWGQEAIDKLIE